MQDLYKVLYFKKKPFLVFFFIILISSIVLAENLVEPYNDPITYSVGDSRWCRLIGCTITDLIVDSLTVYDLSVIGDVFNVTMNLVEWNITTSFNVGGNLEAKNITADNFFYSDGTSINDTLSSDYVPYIGATDDVDLGNNDFWARDGNFSGNVRIDDDLYARDGYFDRNVYIAFDLEVTDDTVLLDTLKVYGISTFYNDFRVYDDATFNDSITLKRDGGDAILEVETEDTAGSSQIRVLADGTNDLYIYTYGSTAPATYYGFPRAGSSYVDAQGERLIIGTFDTAPLYLATSQDPRLLITGTGDVLPFDDDDYMLGNATNRFEDFYVVGESTQGVHFVQDDYSYGNLSMDDNFNLLWNGHIINATAIGTSWNGSVNYYTKSETNSTYLKLDQTNWYNDPNGWLNWNNAEVRLEFNESKLSSIYYNATQSNTVTGTIDAGTLANTQHPDGAYDGVTLNFSEASGSPGLDLRINFTGVEDFNRGIIRYKTSSLAGDFPIIQMWNYNDSIWEDYPPIGESETFATITQPVFDSSDHIEDGVAQMRIYKSSNGNTNNHYYVDWIAITKGFGTPSGEEIDPHFEEWLNNPILEYKLNASEGIVTPNITADDGTLEVYSNVNLSTNNLTAQYINKWDWSNKTDDGSTRTWVWIV